MLFKIFQYQIAIKGLEENKKKFFQMSTEDSLDLSSLHTIKGDSLLLIDELEKIFQKITDKNEFAKMEKEISVF